MVPCITSTELTLRKLSASLYHPYGKSSIEMLAFALAFFLFLLTEGCNSLLWGKGKSKTKQNTQPLPPLNKNPHRKPNQTTPKLNCNETNAPLPTCRNSSIFMGQLKYNLDASERTASLPALMHYARSQTSPNAITASWTLPNLPVSISPLSHSSAFPLKIGLFFFFFLKMFDMTMWSRY